MKTQCLLFVVIFLAGMRPFLWIRVRLASEVGTSL